MNTIKLHDHYFKPFISQEAIAEVVHRMAQRIKSDLEGEIPLFIGIMNGSFVFAADFIREYDGDCEISFVKLASYEGKSTLGTVKKLIGINENLEGRTIVILEDIIDTGTTLEEVYEIFRNQKIKQLKIATLFLKPDVFRKGLPVDYIGISIPDKFIVGYGLDYNGLGRNLKSVYQLTTHKMTNIVLFGPPGAGKGTQAEILKEHYNLVHISTGDVFRYNIKNETQLGLLAKSFMDKGDLVPDKVTIDMLEAEVDKNPDANGFIFDGFPRTEDQAKALDAFLAKKNEGINAMIALEVPEDLLVARLLERGKTSGRPDDQDEDKIRNRFNEYTSKTAILKDFYAAQDKYYGVDGVGDIEEITARLKTVIDAL